MQVNPQLYDMHYTFVDIKMWDITAEEWIVVSAIRQPLHNCIRHSPRSCIVIKGKWLGWLLHSFQAILHSFQCNINIKCGVKCSYFWIAADEQPNQYPFEWSSVLYFKCLYLCTDLSPVNLGENILEELCCYTIPDIEMSHPTPVIDQQHSHHLIQILVTAIGYHTPSYHSPIAMIIQ